jgi:DnaJ-class molecular chaperone
MSETVVYECGHCDGKGVCERGNGRWSCYDCLRSSGFADPSNHQKNAVKCSVCGGSGKIVKVVK